ncbi:MAG: DUF4436 family protein [Mycobacterium sp.]|nr:DUF4436 family protein [Mycobacterium sp.]
MPGSPPIGSIIDFGSFFIAETVISISLISSIVFGFRHQMALEREEQKSADQLAGGPSGQAVVHKTIGSDGDTSDGPVPDSAHDAQNSEGSDNSD